MFKVTIQDDYVIQNGVPVARLEGRGEVWVIPVNPDRSRHVNGAIARFKYMSPKAKAKKFVRFAYSRFTPDDIHAACRLKAPLMWAREHGYVGH